MNILDKIKATKRKEVEKRKTEKPVESLKNSSFYQQKVFSSKASVLSDEKTGIIAEFKRQSPSKGIINGNVTVEEVVSAYEKHGASVVSVLTDEKYFGGSVEDLACAKAALTIPVLRKDFIIDAYQVYETKSIGADLMLLIAECLTEREIYDLAKLAKEIGLEVLLEMHDESQLNKINPYIDLVGINNRDLKTFVVDIEKSKKLLKKIPDEFVKVAESGISGPEMVKELKSAGFQAFLIGENFMKEENPGLAFEKFVKDLKG